MAIKTIVRVLIVIVGLAIIVIALNATGVLGKIVGKAKSKSNWQAVFLTNGQVYFGKIVSENKDYIVLRNIYYLQIEQPIQPEKPNQSPPPPKLSLVKLGNELHGPKDEMRISRSQVVFIEDLKDDGKVVSAITEFEKSGGQNLQTQTQATPQPTPTP
jgi:hypothetical protein